MPRLRATPEERKARDAELEAHYDAVLSGQKQYGVPMMETPVKPTKTDAIKGNETLPDGVTLNDFSAFMPMHSYIYQPTREMWPAASVNARIEPVPVVDDDGEPVADDKGTATGSSANAWLDRNSAVEQMTWAPGEPMLIRDRLVSNGGWVERDGVTCFNLYRPPIIQHGDAAKAGRGSSTSTRSTARSRAHHQVHGLQGSAAAGQDQSRASARRRAGHRQGHAARAGQVCSRAVEFRGGLTQQVCGRFNGFSKSVILRISEAARSRRRQPLRFLRAHEGATPPRRRTCCASMKSTCASTAVFNVCGVIITTNYKTNGIYLPADDRRHYVAWSNLTKEDFTTAYWDESVELVRGRRHRATSPPISPASISPTSIRRPRRRRRRPSGPSSMPTARRRTASLPTRSTGLGQETIGEDGEPEIIRPKAVTIDKIATGRRVATSRCGSKTQRTAALFHTGWRSAVHACAQPTCQGWPVEDQWPSASRLCPEQHDAQRAMEQANALAGTAMARTGQ